MPMSPTIRRLGPGDASVLDEVAPDVFDNAIDPRGTADSSPIRGTTLAWRRTSRLMADLSVRLHEEYRGSGDPRISSKSREHPPGVPRL